MGTIRSRAARCLVGSHVVVPWLVDTRRCGSDLPLVGADAGDLEPQSRPSRPTPGEPMSRLRRPVQAEPVGTDLRRSPATSSAGTGRAPWSAVVDDPVDDRRPFRVGARRRWCASPTGRPLPVIGSQGGHRPAPNFANLRANPVARIPGQRRPPRSDRTGGRRRRRPSGGRAQSDLRPTTTPTGVDGPHDPRVRARTGRLTAPPLSGSRPAGPRPSASGRFPGSSSTRCTVRGA